VTLAWQKALAAAMARGPEACGVARPTWAAPLLASYLADERGGRERSARVATTGVNVLRLFDLRRWGWALSRLV
jgi:hypothetical protein